MQQQQVDMAAMVRTAEKEAAALSLQLGRNSLYSGSSTLVRLPPTDIKTAAAAAASLLQNSNSHFQTPANMPVDIVGLLGRGAFGVVYKGEYFEEAGRSP